ncbi:helix-turn-helix domain-containing protein [Flammeovirga aprica]|uniref:Helix-turn-helix transcriptional regulator n=1 Tax=Flammeovirga aprica JL-4 TaxID=694437 RepID=A0A7X9XC08_9BACT|nr:helix-turn-helix transcriptional regulator [Flammeovirga aprica]NME71260.1 helix-turn-helix transcriptional regulator [Flammeovirga aprica JL-4]
MKNIITILLLILCCQVNAFSNNVGHISGKLILDDSWDRKIYVSYLKTFEKEYAVSNDIIITSATIDSLGNFKIDLEKVPTEWSFFRLHIVKKGVSPNSLVIGSLDENFIHLIAKQDSEIELFNTGDRPIFSGTRIKGADYMKTFDYIKKLSNYPNSIDYEKSIIEKEFIKEVVSEKLKSVADTCKHPLVSLYAIYQTDFQADYLANPKFYEGYLSKWENENNPYFNSFRQKFHIVEHDLSNENTIKHIIFFISVVGFLTVSVLILFKRKNQNINQLSLQERKIFGLLRNGLSNKEISAECNIELTTVKSHISSIYSKLKIKSRKEAVNLKSKSI